jgi:hypothetical protein
MKLIWPSTIVSTINLFNWICPKNGVKMYQFKIIYTAIRYKVIKMKMIKKKENK